MRRALLGAFQCTITDVARIGIVPPITGRKLNGRGDATAKILWAVAIEFELDVILYGVS
jgi:hypothetical protein